MIEVPHKRLRPFRVLTVPSASESRPDAFFSHWFPCMQIRTAVDATEMIKDSYVRSQPQNVPKDVARR